MSTQEQSGEPITQAGIEELKAELAEMEGPARQKMAERIKVAREEGDLKENAEYHVAKEDQAHLETRIKRMQERLRNAVVVEVSELDSDVFSFGRTAEVLDESKDETNAWTLVGSFSMGSALFVSGLLRDAVGWRTAWIAFAVLTLAAGAGLAAQRAAKPG